MAEKNLPYTLLIGIASAALYSGHKVIGLYKLNHIQSFERYTVIRQYKQHIWLYCIGWSILSIWFLIPLFNIRFLLWLLPGGIIALMYILPIIPGKKRLRDLGWAKILMIGWSWAWLTAFLPAYYFSEIALHLAIIHGIERMLFIIAITIPFEIRDIEIDTSVGLKTAPERFGMKATLWTGRVFCVLIIMLAFYLSFHFFNPAYGFAMAATCFLTIWIMNKSGSVKDDYFFSGLTDGTMILALFFYSVFVNFI